MTRQKKFVSIKNALQFSNTLMIILTIVPIILISSIYLISHIEYQQMIRNVQVADGIRRRSNPDIRNSLWYQIVGRERKGKAPVQVIYGYQKELQNLKEDASTTDLRQTTDVSLRLLQTIEHYAWQIDSNINNNRPVSDNQELLDVIDSVNDQLSESLQEYVTKEIELATSKSRRISKLIYFLIFAELLIVLGLLLFIRYFRRKLDQEINGPINDISKMVEKISHGRWQARVPKIGLAELDGIGHDLNTMADQIEKLFYQNTQKQKSLAVSEMKVLQAQITPHFIYNTLDAIITLAQEGQMEPVEQATLALSNYFKITLNKGNEWITVEREIEHIKSYLNILKIRYGAILSFEINIDPNIEDLIILKMILQPIVENAMYHGIKISRRRGKINISGNFDQAKQHLVFTVSDNGIGMTPETLAEVNRNLEQIAGHSDSLIKLESGYGLYNVYQRLRLYFGREANISIESIRHQGTTVTLILPYKHTELERSQNA